METIIWIFTAVVLYLCLAYWVYSYTTPIIYDDSQLIRSLKLGLFIPILVAAVVALIVLMVVTEYWEFRHNRKRVGDTIGPDAAQLEGGFRQ